MNICEYMSPPLVEMNFSAEDKQQLLEKLVEGIHRRNLIEEPAEVLNSLIERERLMTTGIKKGYAIPHAFTQQIEKSIVFFVRLVEPIDYQSLDGEPVSIVFLLIGPPNAQGIHLKLLARLARLLSQGHLFKNLMAAETPEEIIDIIGKEETHFNLSKTSS